MQPKSFRSFSMFSRGYKKDFSAKSLFLNETFRLQLLLTCAIFKHKLNKNKNGAYNMQNITQLTQHSYLKNCAAVTCENFALLTKQQQTQFTQAEAAFVLQFVVDTLQSLTLINVENAEEEQYFVRLTDAQEVCDNLQMLYNCLCNNTATYTFTIAQAAQALCAYDTEYRECICEQFEDACNEAAVVAEKLAHTNVNFATLALRIMYNY